ncbi:MAG: host attachment protein, partial [Tistlia sp.]
AIHFLQEVVEAVDQAGQRGAFDRLLLVAPPRALGELRKLLPERLAGKVTDELAQDLTKHTVGSLAAHLAAHGKT